MAPKQGTVQPRDAFEDMPLLISGLTLSIFSSIVYGARIDHIQPQTFIYQSVQDLEPVQK
jgi:hypothetical protein